MSHACKIASCTRLARDQQLMCWPHWRGLPRQLKDAIFETFRNGPAADYRANVEQAVKLIDEKEGRA